MNARETHDRAVERLAAEYEAQGYQVQRDALLPFAVPDGRAYRADLVAERAGEHLVVEVKLSGVAEESRRWRELANEIRSHAGWHFRIVAVDREPTPIPDAERVEAAIANAEALLAGENLPASVLVAASAFEAAALRRLSALGALPRSATGAALVERLVSEGELDQHAFVPLRDAIDHRNAIAHGHLDAPARREDVEHLVSSARLLLAAA